MIKSDIKILKKSLDLYISGSYNWSPEFHPENTYLVGRKIQ